MIKHRFGEVKEDEFARIMEYSTFDKTKKVINMAYCLAIVIMKRNNNGINRVVIW